jgi:hypothetical protein
MVITEQDIEHGKEYVACFTGGWIPVKADFTELAIQHATFLKEEYGDDWFNHKSVQNIVDPFIWGK